MLSLINKRSEMNQWSVLVLAVAVLAGVTAVPKVSAEPSVPVFKDPRPANGTTKPLPKYVVDLDKPPKERWAHVVKPYAAQMKALIAYVKKMVSPKVFDDITAILGDLDNALGEPWADEIRGAADAINVDVGDLVFTNFYYEFDTACTSIVAQRDNGTIYHGRNLDYGLPNLQEMAVEISFQHGNGPTLYRATTYAGYIGTLTGMRPNGFSISIDERWTNASKWENLLDAFKGYRPIGFAMRTALEQKDNFQDAVDYLSSVKLITVSYLIVGGKGHNEGAVITRARDSAADVWRLAYPNRWFLVETNYDHWKPPAKHDNRRNPANKHMHHTNRTTFDQHTMWKVMNMFPNLNSETTYTTVMSADIGYYHCETQNNKQ